MARSKNWQDLTGQKHHRWTVLYFVKTATDRHSTWRCKCACGKEKNVRANFLKGGKSKSCGCLRDEVSGERERLRPYEAHYRHFQRAGSRGGRDPKGISFEDFLELIKVEECQYCGDKVTWLKHTDRGKTPTRYNLDRKNNLEDYTKYNCIVCCKDCNRAKGARYTYDEWLAMTAALKEFRNGRKRFASTAGSTSG